MASKASSGAKVQGEPVATTTGAFTETLKQPVKVGELTIAESKELKARSEVMAKLQADQTHLNRLAIMARTESTKYMNDLLVSRNLDTNNEYQVDPETGTISLVAKYIEQPEAAPVD